MVPELEDLQESHFIKTSEDTTKTAESNEESEGKQSEDDYEIMNRISPQGDSPKANMTAVKESSTPPASSAVNLILSFGNTGDSQVQVLDLPALTDEILKETSEPVHRVRSTQLNTSSNTTYCTHDLFKEKKSDVLRLE